MKKENIKINNKLRYNYNINGSRGLAVILVFIFHLDLNYFNGGFIGVDIFFVISGYVITQSFLHIFKKEKNFIITTKIFFEKRVSRIVPAIIVLSFISIIFFRQILIEKHFISFLQSVFFSNFFLSNFYFWNEFGYFGLENLFKPLLHSWSLSVEIQFYLIVPILFFFLIKKKNLIFFSLIILITVLSLLFGEVFINRPFVYFFPFFRLHEFLFGVCIFYYLSFISNKKLNYKFSYLGIIIIIFSSIFLNETKNFPGFNSLFPIIGILLILISDDKKNILLCNSVTQYLGNISYSFYLYHWPVIVAFKYVTLKTFFNISDIIFIFIITLIFSHLSFKFVELNFKVFKINKKINLFLIIIFLLTTFYSCSFFQQNKNKEIKKDFFKEQIILRDSLLNKIQRGNYKKSKIIIIGDSHAQDLLISLSHYNKFVNTYNPMYLPLNDTCLKYFNRKSFLNNIENFITNKFKISGQNFCNEQIDFFMNNLKFIKNNNIIISNRWSNDTLRHFEEILKLISDDKKIVIVNRRPFFFDIPSLLEIKKKINLEELNKLAFELNDKQVIAINEKIKTTAKIHNLNLLNLYKIICNQNILECNIVNKKNIFFIDNDHFSVEGSKFFGGEIIAELDKILNK